MNKQDLILEVAKRSGISARTAERYINATLDAITDECAMGGNVRLAGFGAFFNRDFSERKFRNPVTGKLETAPAKRVLRFTPSLALARAVNANKPVK